MLGNVTALVGWHVTGKMQGRKHDAHMLQACGLGSSQWERFGLPLLAYPTRWSTKGSAGPKFGVSRDQICTASGPKVICARQVEV